MNNSFRIIFIKINVIKADIIKIYTKNIHLITKESNNIRVYIKSRSASLLENITLTIQTNQEQILMLVSTAISHIFGVLRLSGQYFSVKGCLEIIINYANQSGTDFNAKRQVSTAISHIFGVLRLSGQYFSVKGCLETTLSHIS